MASSREENEMSYTFGKRSRECLDTCHKDLKKIAELAIKFYDFSIYEGHRDLDRQKKLYDEGKSQIDGITRKGNHNYNPSMAFDCAPYPIDWNDTVRFHTLAKVLFVAEEYLRENGQLDNTYELAWGGNWKNFVDLPHWELIKRKNA